MDSAEREELARLYGKAQDATQSLAFVVAKMPLQFGGCASDLRRGKSVSVENVAYQGSLLKGRASEALKAIAALHEYAAQVLPDQEQGAA